MKDRAMQALYLLALEPIAETAADPNSYGFRPKRSTADALQQCFNTLCRGCSPQWVLEGDIKGCFDHISHQWMLQHVLTDKVVLQTWLKAGYIENRTLFPTEAGTPQGGIISPALANLVLDGLEPLLKQHFPVKYAREVEHGKKPLPPGTYKLRTIQKKEKGGYVQIEDQNGKTYPDWPLYGLDKMLAAGFKRMD